MKQDLIDAFIVKNANKLKVDEKIELQKQLKTCDDKAFSLLMSHKKPTTKSNFWRRLLCVLSPLCLIASIVFISLYCTLGYYSRNLGCYCYYYDPGWLVGAILCILAIIAFIGLLIYWKKKGVLKDKLKSMPKRKRLYMDYLKIIHTYQEKAEEAVE